MNPATGLIDAHVHLYETQNVPSRTMKETEESTTEANPIPRVAPSSISPPHFTPNQLFEHCTPHGINRIVLIQMIHYRQDNSHLISLIENHPATFRGVAVLDHRRPETPQQMTSLLAKKITGFRLYGIEQTQVGSWPDSEGMNSMWRRAAETGQALSILMEPESLPILGRLLQRHPATRVVIDHMSRIGMAGPIQQRQIDELCRLAAFPNLYVKTSAFYALGEKQPPYLDLRPMIRQLRDAFGAERLMWGSDCPFQVEEGHNYADSVALIRDRLDFLTHEDKVWLLSKTAENVYWFV